MSITHKLSKKIEENNVPIDRNIAPDMRRQQEINKLILEELSFLARQISDLAGHLANILQRVKWLEE